LARVTSNTSTNRRIRTIFAEIGVTRVGAIINTYLSIDGILNSRVVSKASTTQHRARDTGNNSVIGKCLRGWNIDKIKSVTSTVGNGSREHPSKNRVDVVGKLIDSGITGRCSSIDLQHVGGAVGPGKECFARNKRRGAVPVENRFYCARWNTPLAKSLPRAGDIVAKSGLLARAKI
jgi:hypothetical protein